MRAADGRTHSHPPSLTLLPHFTASLTIGWTESLTVSLARLTDSEAYRVYSNSDRDGIQRGRTSLPGFRIDLSNHSDSHRVPNRSEAGVAREGSASVYIGECHELRRAVWYVGLANLGL